MTPSEEVVHSLEVSLFDAVALSLHHCKSSVHLLCRVIFLMSRVNWSWIKSFLCSKDHDGIAPWWRLCGNKDNSIPNAYTRFQGDLPPDGGVVS